LITHVRDSRFTKVLNRDQTDELPAGKQDKSISMGEWQGPNTAITNTWWGF